MHQFMKLPTSFIDTFTSVPFKGNPTAVCHVVEELNNQTMLSIASELNYPVTAFIKTKPEKIHSYEIRYFTAITEIPACGHATLAAAKFVRSKNETNDTVWFSTINNITIKAFYEGSKVMMTYPKYEMQTCTVNNNLLASLQLDDYKTAAYSVDLETLFIEIDSATLKVVEPNYQQLIRSSDIIKEVVLTSVSDNNNYDYFLRSFCPWIGINEDPVTGSVHSALGNFWKLRLGKQSMNVYQASLRGGEILVRVSDEHVEIGGEAVIILNGEMTL